MPASNDVAGSLGGSGCCGRCCCCRTRRRKWACGLSSIALVILAVVLGFVFLRVREPQWELRNVAFHAVEVKGLIEGVSAADTSQCPAADPCGVASAKGCSKCLDPNEVNQGCLCGAQPGTVIPSDYSACPPSDPCGVASARGCSTCPGPEWANDGCACRIPITARHLFDALNTFWALVAGEGTQPVSFVLRAEVWVHNPNFIGANTEPGSVDITHAGQLLGSAHVGALTVEGRSEMMVSVIVHVDQLSLELGTLLLQSIIQGQGTLEVRAEGAITAKLGSVAFKTRLACDVTTDVLQGATITSQECTYSYGK